MFGQRPIGLSADLFQHRPKILVFCEHKSKNPSLPQSAATVAAADFMFVVWRCGTHGRDFQRKIFSQTCRSVARPLGPGHTATGCESDLAFFLPQPRLQRMKFLQRGHTHFSADDHSLPAAALQRAARFHEAFLAACLCVFCVPPCQRVLPFSLLERLT